MKLPSVLYHRIKKLATFKILFAALLFFSYTTQASETCEFKVIAFYTAKNDAAHISFVREANQWFAEMGKQFDYCFEATPNWELLNESYLSAYQVVLFLDSRPEDALQRIAFENYMRQGGGWMGFHFSAFALTPSAFPDNWDWYQNVFLGSGAYKGNTWRPTAAVLKIEAAEHPATVGLPNQITAAPNEWYSWEKNLQENPDINILASIDPGSYPLGTGPKPHEIWHSGYYPVVWTHTLYKMVYFNMGHNDIDYENHTGKELSSTFSSPDQNQLILNALLWLGHGGQK